VNAAALLTDGSVVTVRELGPDDVSALVELHRGLPVGVVTDEKFGPLVDARVRVAPVEHTDPFPRRLRTP
jgi:hypothetical protein